MFADAKIRTARAHLLADQPFFGTLIHDMELVPADEARGVSIPTMATDCETTIYYNRDFVDGLTLGEVKGVLCHEVMHKANGHHLRRGTREPGKWNEAADYAINPLILASKMALPKIGLINPAYAGKSAEEIYALREKAQQKGTQGAKAPSGIATAPGKGNAPGGHPAPLAGHIFDATAEDGSPLSPSEVKQKLADLQVQVLQAARAAERVGGLPSAAERLVAEARNPRTDWRDILRRFVSDAGRPEETSWRRVNRRALGMGVYLPGYVRSGIAHLAIVLDTSGSIDNIGPAREQFMAEMRRILEDVNVDLVTVMCCDDRVRWQRSYEDKDEVEFKWVGGGATAFHPAFTALDKAEVPPSAVIYFTDLIQYGIVQPPEYPVLWAKWQGNHPGRPQGFGEIVEIK
jgi:predicted metal-dependent peptidase